MADAGCRHVFPFMLRPSGGCLGRSGWNEKRNDRLMRESIQGDLELGIRLFACTMFHTERDSSVICRSLQKLDMVSSSDASVG